MIVRTVEVIFGRCDDVLRSVQMIVSFSEVLFSAVFTEDKH